MGAFAIQDLVRGKQKAKRQELEQLLERAAPLPDTDRWFAIGESDQLVVQIVCVCQVRLGASATRRGDAIQVAQQLQSSRSGQPRVAVEKRPCRPS